jgi:hypothetical protein
VPSRDCSCDANPTVSKFVGCLDGNPHYFNDSTDIPNGACIMYVNGKKEGTSLTICNEDSDCFDSLTCYSGRCKDENGVIELNRLVQACVSPKSYSSNPNAGCGTSDGDKILECHKYWIGDEGMPWRDYLQYNPHGTDGTGDIYCWAYDEAICAKAGNTRTPNGYPWCSNTHDPKQGAVDSSGHVTDSSCPCTVNNAIAPLGAIPFSQNGWGVNMHVNIFSMMYPGYSPPTSFNPV